jgi:WD40 repeat protein
MLVWKGHGAKVRSLAFAPDGRSFATTAGNSKFVWLWEATTGKLLQKLGGRQYAATRLAAFFPDGQHVVGLHQHRRATVWHIETGTRVAELETTSWLSADAVAIPPDGSKLLLYAGGQFAEWDDPARPTPGQRRCDRYRPLPDGFYYPFQMGYSPGGRYFWVTSHTLMLYHPATLALGGTLADDEGAGAMAVAFTPDESRVCAAFGHRAAIFRRDEPHEPPVKLRGHKQQVRAVGFLPGGGTVLTAAMDGTVRLWDANTGAEQRSFDWGIGKVRIAAISPDGTTCAAGSDDGRLVVWDVDL